MPSNTTFIRHYAEMVVAMFAGMFVLMAPAGAFLQALGTSWSDLSPAAYLFAMTCTMGIPMALWMRIRGHAWRPNAEMVGAMFLPVLAIMPLLATHVVRSGGPLTLIEHAGMLTAMLGAMLLRRDEYGFTH